MLNDDLYLQLKEVFGEVRLANLGEPLLIEQRRGLDGKMHPWKISSGEQYRVCCPCCGDSRFRLYISYAYGLDRKVGYPSSKLVVCHNERCHENDDRSRGVKRNAVYFLERALGRGYLKRADKGLVVIDDADLLKTAEPPNCPFPLPEWRTPVADLPFWHPAKRYIDSRGFTVEQLAKWGVVWCHTYPVTTGSGGQKKSWAWLKERLFIPTPSDGWQARTLDTSSALKYFTKPGWKKSQHLYGAANAQKWPFVLVTEGVTDVWRIDGPAVCLFGKAASATQLKALYRTWSTVGVMLDPDADSDKRGSVRRLIRDLRGLTDSVFRVELPDGKDPAECTYDVVWDCIEAAAIAAGTPAVVRPERQQRG